MMKLSMEIYTILEYDNCIYCIVNSLTFLEFPKETLSESSLFLRHCL